MAARERKHVSVDPDTVSGEKQETVNPAEDPYIVSGNLDLVHSIVSRHTEVFHNDGENAFDSYQPERSVGQNQKKKSVDLTSAYLSF